MKNEQKIIVFVALAVMFFFGTSIGVAVAPTIEEITLSPPDPTPQSTIIFSVDISGNNISSVRLWLQECNNTICFIPVQNVSMAFDSSSDKYETQITLARPETTYIDYNVQVNYIGGFIKSTTTKLYLAENSNGDQNGGNGNTDKKTPGFELVSFIVAAGLAVLLLRRKRLR
jgi:hypothetical protein